jgi:hypothetical protein
MASDTVVMLHLGFILFVVLGGLVVVRWKWFAWIHIPAAVWGVLIEFRGWVCPLTPLENLLRRAAGTAGYSGGFIDHYLMPLIYPVVLDRRIQITLGVGVIVLNFAVYFFALKRKRKGNG